MERQLSGAKGHLKCRQFDEMHSLLTELEPSRGSQDVSSRGSQYAPLRGIPRRAVGQTAPSLPLFTVMDENENAKEDEVG